MNSFNEFIDKIGNAKELRIIKHVGKLSEENKTKIIEFINKNNIECHYLWENSERGNKSTDNWHKLVEFVLPMIPD